MLSLAIVVPAVALGSAISSALLALVVHIYRRRRYRQIFAARRQLAVHLENLQRHLKSTRDEKIKSENIQVALLALLGSASECESRGDLTGALEKYEQILERLQNRPKDTVATESASNDTVATESASLAASEIAKLSTRLTSKPDKERYLERAVTSLGNIPLANQ